MEFLIAFITGLTTGGLSCLAVQGGLLASTLANQVEQDMQNKSRKGGAKKQIARPIFLFLVAKILAYTLLGLLFGALGSILQLTSLVRAILMIAIGVFMLGNGLRMFNVHPIFRFFVFEPPSSITRYIRRTSKNGASLFTPLFLGALTVLIPCGITQSMLAVALGTGSALKGAGLMFAFTLGTSPVFFSVAYFATRMGAKLEKYFTRLVAVTVIVLGLVSVNSGLALAGSPLSLSLPGLSPTAAPVSQNGPAAAAGDTFSVQVTDDGYSPQVLHLPANRAISLNWVSENVHSCALSVVVPDLSYEKVLPSTGQVALQIPSQPKGTLMRYSCSMGMYLGQLVFDLQ
jgi:sulfite exporter TauE/SafE